MCGVYADVYKRQPAEVVERGLAFLAEEGHALDFVRDAKDILTPEVLQGYPVVINAKGNVLTGANDAPWFEAGVTEAGPEELREYVEAGGGFLSLHAGNSFKAEENRAYTDFVGNSFVKHLSLIHIFFAGVDIQINALKT